MKKKLVLLLTALMIFAGSAGNTLSASAEEAKSYPMYDPMVRGSEYKVYGPTIKINQFSGCISGCCVLSSKEDIVRMMGGFTQEELNNGAEPILYVADHYDESEERKLINETVKNFGGTVVCALDMQLFKYIGKETIRCEESSVMLQLIIGIPEEAHYVKLWEQGNDREFAMVRVHDGKAEILRDTDTDVRTLTFNSDKFSIYAMVYAPKGNIDAYLEQLAAAGPAPAEDKKAADSELDEVPKMGDSAWETRVTYGMGRRRG